MSDGLFEAFIYLLAALVAVPLAKRLGLGSVIGYLVAGAVIGPYALNLAGGAADVMPQNSGARDEPPARL